MMNQSRNLTRLIRVCLKDMENKKPSITNLATTDAVTAVDDKIPNVSDFVKKADYNEKRFHQI